MEGGGSDSSEGGGSIALLRPLPPPRRRIFGPFHGRSSRYCLSRSVGRLVCSDGRTDADSGSSALIGKESTTESGGHIWHFLSRTTYAKTAMSAANEESFGQKWL